MEDYPKIYIGEAHKSVFATREKKCHKFAYQTIAREYCGELTPRRKNARSDVFKLIITPAGGMIKRMKTIHPSEAVVSKAICPRVFPAVRFQ